MRSVLLVAAAAAAKQPPLWPLPQNYSCSTQKLTVIPSPAFFRVDAGNDVLAAAATRYTLAFPHGWGAPGVGLPALSVVVDDGVGRARGQTSAARRRRQPLPPSATTRATSSASRPRARRSKRGRSGARCGASRRSRN